jgi:hypothetical protein
MNQVAGTLVWWALHVLARDPEREKEKKRRRAAEGCQQVLTVAWEVMVAMGAIGFRVA